MAGVDLGGVRVRLQRLTRWIRAAEGEVAAEAEASLTSQRLFAGPAFSRRWNATSAQNSR